MLLLGSVAVAVTASPAPLGEFRSKLKLTFPLPSVVTGVEPWKTLPSPKPEELQAGFEKNSIRKVVLGVLFNVPLTVVVPPTVAADVRTG